MKVTLPEFERAGVMVVGDVMLDCQQDEPTSRISPEAPVPVVKVNTIEERPGGAANVAMNIASRRQCSPGRATGIDDAARALSKSLADVNVKCDFVSVPTHPTITKLRVLSRNQQLIRLILKKVSKVLIPAAARAD
ncbi:PfkB family carbohydrate kinase [Escherichia coli]